MLLWIGSDKDNIWLEMAFKDINDLTIWGLPAETKLSLLFMHIIQEKF